MSQPQDPQPQYDFLAGAGEVRQLLRARGGLASCGWKIAEWPSALRNLVGLILDSKFPMYVLWGKEHRCLYNDAYIPILNDRHPAGLGLPFEEIFPEIWADCSPLVERAYAGESVFIEDFPLVIMRGGFPEHTYFTFSYSPVRDGSGTVNGMYCVCTETTVKVIAERRQAFNLDMADQLRGLWDPREITTRAAELLGRQLKVPRVFFADFDAGNGTVVYHSNYTDGSAAPVSGTWNKASFGKGVDGLFRHGGTQVYEDIRADPRTSSAGMLGGFASADIRSGIAVSAFRQGELMTALIVSDSVPRAWTRSEIVLVEDVATRTWNAIERSRAEEARSKQRTAELERLRNIFEQAPGFVALLSGADHVFELVNAAYYQAVGHRDIIGKPVREALPEVEGQGFIGILNRVFATGSAFVGKGQAIRLQRSPATEPEERYVDFVYQPLHDSGGAVYGIFVQGIDVTERLRAEREVRELNETLEERVASRGKELERTHEQLRQAQKMEAVGQLTGGLAHDFNNILASVVANLELMQIRLAQGRTAELASHIDGAMAASGRASALTHRLLAFARRQTLAPKVVDVNQLAASLIEMIERAVGPAIKVTPILAQGLWKTRCDVNQLENALLNLAINARDAMPGGGELTIATSNADEAALGEVTAGGAPGPGKYVVISVTDTGTGMTEEVVSRAFDPFFTTKPIGQGTGLGLSMIFGFVNQSSGHIRLQSAVGQGTTVRLYLPWHDASAEADSDSRAVPAPVHAPAHAPDPAPPPSGVLIVDDEAPLRHLLCERLKESGYAAFEAQDAQDAVRILQSSSPIDLLVTDVGLPGALDGRQLADTARASRPELKVMFITGYAENGILPEGAPETDMAVMVKPFPLGAFVQNVHAMVEAAGRRMQRPALTAVEKRLR